MKNRDVLSEQVDQFISQSFWVKSGIPLNENTDEVLANAAPEISDEIVETEEAVHSCPLCESVLDAEITKDQLQEHVNSILEIIQEMNEITDDELIEAIETEV